MLVYFVAICNILRPFVYIWPFGLFYGHLVYLWSFGIFIAIWYMYGHLVHFMAIWFILWPFLCILGTFVNFCVIWYYRFWCIVPGKIWQPWSIANRMDDIAHLPPKSFLMAAKRERQNGKFSFFFARGRKKEIGRNDLLWKTKMGFSRFVTSALLVAFKYREYLATRWPQIILAK
jgi:hypothetical protein